MIELARCPEGELSAQTIAGRCEATIPFLEQVLMSLRVCGLLRSRRGRNGGYRLARSPSEITVGEILRALEGPLGPAPCADLEDPAACAWCEEKRPCELRPLWVEVSAAVASILDNRTLAAYAKDASIV
jgi:Rrf2 family protein